MTLKLSQAEVLAYRLHGTQTDRAGRPYAEHLHAVRKGVKVLGGGREEQIGALLHDAVEDGHITLEQLRGEGCSEQALTIVDALTKRPNEPWRVNLSRVVAAGPGACRVKVADLLHNTRHDRVAALRAIEGDTTVEARLARYRESLALLLRELDLL